MTSINNNQKIAYGLSQPTTSIFPAPVVAKRAPNGNDKYPIGTTWIYDNQVFTITSIVNGLAVWSTFSVVAIGAPGPATNNSLSGQVSWTGYTTASGASQALTIFNSFIKTTSHGTFSAFSTGTNAVVLGVSLVAFNNGNVTFDVTSALTTAALAVNGPIVVSFVIYP